jgi:hypothetical protein
VRRVPRVLLLAVAAAVLVGPAWGVDPITLEERAAVIERVSTEPDGARVVIGHLSRTLHMPTDELRTQRMQTGLGWGDLLVANLISKMAGLTFDQVAGEFGSGKSWEAIARDHQVNLEKLAGDVDRSEEIVERREEDRPPVVSSGDGSSRRGPNGSQSGGGARRTRH